MGELHSEPPRILGAVWLFRRNTAGQVLVIIASLMTTGYTVVTAVSRADSLSRYSVV